MRHPALSFSLLLALSSPLVARPEVQFKGTSIVLTDRGKRFELPHMIDPHSFHETVHAVHRRGNSYFIVYGTSEMSRGWPPRGGHCGSGVESFICWLHVADGQVVARHEGLYESCFKNRDGWQISWANHKLIWSTTGIRRKEGPQLTFESMDLNWTFDPAHPELGISETEQPSKWQPTQ